MYTQRSPDIGLHSIKPFLDRNQPGASKIIFIGRPHVERDREVYDLLEANVPEVRADLIISDIQIRYALDHGNYSGVLFMGLRVPIIGDPKTFDLTTVNFAPEAEHTLALSIIRYVRNMGLPSLVDSNHLPHIRLARQEGAITADSSQSARFLEIYRNLFNVN